MQYHENEATMELSSIPSKKTPMNFYTASKQKVSIQVASTSSAACHNPILAKLAPKKVLSNKVASKKVSSFSSKRQSMNRKVAGKSRAHKRQAKDSGIQWREVWHLFDNPNSSREFVEFSGCARGAAGDRSPLEFFQFFFTPEIVNDIVEQTNLYGMQQSKRNNAWTYITYEEILAFFGISIAMGIIDLPSIKDYWSSSSILQVPWFPSVMSRGRFITILSSFHLADNRGLPPKDDPKYKLYKLGTLPTELNKSFGAMYKPTRDLSIDEQMIGTKCRVGFLQYMPKKPKKFGIKVWALCEALTGYCLKFDIYTGKTQGHTEHGLAYRVVFELLENYLNKHHHVYFDNFYSTLKLLSDLEQEETFACGTIRSDRGSFPETFTRAKLKRGESVYLRHGNIVAVHWFDKRDVYAVSSIHNNSEQEVTRRGDSVPVMKPRIISEYNKYMNGVDKCDQYLSSYSLCRKSMKWWKKVFFRMFELAIINAMVLYFDQNESLAKNRSSHKHFRISLIHELVHPLFTQRADTTSPLSVSTPGRKAISTEKRLKGKHFPTSRFPE